MSSACSPIAAQRGGSSANTRSALVQQPEQRQRHGRLRTAVASEESAHRGQIVAEPPSGNDDHSPTGRVRGHIVAQRANREGAEDHREMVDRLDRGVRIVHRRGQMPCRPCRRVAGCRARRPVARCARTRPAPCPVRARWKMDRVGRRAVRGCGPHPREHRSRTRCGRRPITPSRTCTPCSRASGNSSSGYAVRTYPGYRRDQRHRPFGRGGRDVFDSAQTAVHHGQSVPLHPSCRSCRSEWSARGGPRNTRPSPGWRTTSAIAPLTASLGNSSVRPPAV